VAIAPRSRVQAFCATVAVAILGCSSQLAAPSDAGAGGDAQGSCAATPAKTNASACPNEDAVCTVGFSCEVTMEDVHCVCQEGQWRCFDPIGLMAPGSAPRCIEPGSPIAACPSSMSSATGAACSEIERACFYEGAVCESGVTKLDYCLCLRSDGGSMAYTCFSLPCGPELEPAR
jgi:hypothetical protein